MIAANVDRAGWTAWSGVALISSWVLLGLGIGIAAQNSRQALRVHSRLDGSIGS